MPHLLYTDNLNYFIIGQNYCSMLSTQNTIQFQKELPNSITTNGVWTKPVKHNNNKTKSKHEILVRTGNQTWDLWHRNLIPNL